MCISQTGTERSWKASGMEASRHMWEMTADRWPPAEQPPTAMRERLRLNSDFLCSRIWICVSECE